MQLMPDPLRPGVTETITLDPKQLEEALALDAEQAPVISIDQAKVEP